MERTVATGLAPSGTGLRALFDGSERYSRKWSGYFAVYERTLSRFVGQGITFVEVGVAGGGSLLMWKNYFQNARVIGIDIDPGARDLTGYGIEIFIGDQASEEFWNAFYAAVGPIDVLIDDGGHSNEQQIVTATQALRNVRDNGVVLVEDVHASYMRDCLNPSRHSFINFAKSLVDGVNSRAPFVAEKRPYRDVISSLEFHESIVVIHVDRAQAIEPVEVESCVKPLARPAAPLPDRLRFVRHIPLAGPVAVRCLMLWRRMKMNRRLSRYFQQAR